MFNEDDFENIKKYKTEIADGVFDASSSYQVLETVVKMLSDTDYESDEGRTVMMMEMINLCYEGQAEDAYMSAAKVTNVIISLCFCYGNLIGSFINEGFNQHDYFNFVINQILPVMKEESQMLPYWEDNNE